MLTLQPHPSRSIRVRLVATFVLLVLCTGGTITFVTQLVMQQMMQRDAISHLDEVAARVELTTEDWADSLQDSLVHYVEHSRPQLDVVLAARSQDADDYKRAFGHLTEDLSESLDQNGHFDKLALLDASGATLFSIGDGPDTRLVLTAECLPPAISGPCLQPLRSYPALRGPALVAAQPILDAEGRLHGLVAGYARASALHGMLGAETSNTVAIALFGGDRTTLVSLPAGRHPGGASDLGPAPGPGEQTPSSTADPVASFYEDERGIAVIGVSQWLPRLRVAVLVEQDQAAAFRPAQVALNLHLWVTVLLLTIGGLTALLIVRGIIAPLQALAATAGRIAEGALDVTAEVRQDDEIGALARVFNQMTARLAQARDQLEQRVQQRTEELACANADLRRENAERRRAEQTVEFERNKLKSILDAMDDGVYIVSQLYVIEYVNPALEREFGPVGGRYCYEYLYGRSAACAHCPNDLVWRGEAVRREDRLGNGRVYDTFDTPLASADGVRTKLAIFHDVTARRQAEDEIRQRNGELAVLSRRLVEVQEGERQHIARELHDETGQALTSLMLRLAVLERTLPREVLATGAVVAIKRSVEEVIEGLHRLAADLRPSSLDHVGLVPALRLYTERLAERHALSVDFAVLGLDGERLPAEMEITIYRIVQEALVNVVRHAGASHVDVLLERRPATVRVVVEDNGRGFDVEAGLYTGRLGLIGMRERAEMIGGSLVVDSAPGEGAMVLMEAPL